MRNTPTTYIDTDPDPASAVWLGIIYAIYACLGVPANLLVLLLSVNKNVRTHPVNICIMSIAFADMMVLISFLSSTIWAYTYNITVCKVLGVTIYIFVLMSMMLPSCLALCRYAALRNARDTHPLFSRLRTRKDIAIINGMFWSYGFLYTLPFVTEDKFGLDAIGSCGIVQIDSLSLWAYYLVAVCGILFVAYAVTYIYYRKLSEWVRTTSALISITSQTKETLILTRNIMRMIRWTLFIPFAFYYPALIVQLALRIYPHIISVRVARIFMITCPLSHAVDPLITVLFVKCYRVALIEIFRGKLAFAFKTNSVQPFDERHTVPPPALALKKAENNT